ncbi:MAG: serine hydroxymethyltransferase [Candidatus Liptonbacteria bacterium]|nr:serine hydroxymethyltransferase [Candidatus Liptonbacteria bacterium]
MLDKKLNFLIKKEKERQKKEINLIASENFVSREILEILGSPLVNKYSEGYPGRRYYPGNQYYDEIEKLAQHYALKVFNLSPNKWHVNVQPYSGSSANFAAYSALTTPKDKILGMKLSSGGHLTHGHPVSLVSRFFKFIQYGTDKNGLLDFNEIQSLAQKFRPKIIVSGATAYSREIKFKKFGEIAKSVGAYHLVDISHIAGLVSAKLHQSPFPYADVVTTTTHKTLRGPRSAVIFCKKEFANLIDKAVFPGLQGGPHNNVTAAKAQAFYEALKPSFKKYQKQIVKNAKVLADSLKSLGFNLITGGTDNHLILIDIKSSFGHKNSHINGLIAEKLLEKNGITANRNSVPGDTSPFNPSGIRIGVPAVTTQGMKENDMKKIAKRIYTILSDVKN